MSNKPADDSLGWAPAWGPDHLTPVTPGKGPQPNPLSSPFPADLSEGDQSNATTPSWSPEDAERRLQGVLTANGFDTVGAHRFEKALKWKGREYPAGGISIWGEREIRLDATRERRIRIRMYAGVAVGALLLVLTLYVAGLSGISRGLIVLGALGSGTSLAVAMISLGQDSFWSELVTIHLSPIGTPPPTPPAPPVMSQVTSLYGQAFRSLASGQLTPLAPPPPKGWTPSGGWSLESRAAVVRSANWASKTGSGRNVAEAHRLPRLSDVLSAINAATQEGAQPLASEPGT